jgi:hypothetical protein
MVLIVSERGKERPMKGQVEWDAILSVLQRRRFAFVIGPCSITKETPPPPPLGSRERVIHAPATITYQTRLSYGGDEFLVELRSFGRYTSLQVTIATERKKKGLWAPPFFIEGWRDKKTPNLRLLATTLANKIRGKMFADIHVGDDP